MSVAAKGRRPRRFVDWHGRPDRERRNDQSGRSRDRSCRASHRAAPGTGQRPVDVTQRRTNRSASHLLSQAKLGVSSLELARQPGVRRNTAWKASASSCK